MEGVTKVGTFGELRLHLRLSDCRPVLDDSTSSLTSGAAACRHAGVQSQQSARTVTHKMLGPPASVHASFLPAAAGTGRHGTQRAIQFG